MPKSFTDNTFSSTYKDDWKDSDHYHRILFNAGRALQARELTQMQTIIQEEIRKFANNIFQKDGVPIKTGGMSINNDYAYIKIATDTNNKFDDVASLKGVVLTGQTNNIKVRVVEAVAATDSDPDTLYVTYLDDPRTQNGYDAYNLAQKIAEGEVISNGSDINMTVAVGDGSIGYGCQVEVGEAEFYANGHFIFVEKQSLILKKYERYPSDNIGFKLVQDIITVSDEDALYDNQGAVPNRASPGADRYRLRLILAAQSSVIKGDTFVHYAKIEAGQIVNQIAATEGYNEIRNFVRKRTKEIHGDFITKYWKMRPEPNGKTWGQSDDFLIKVDPGTAYLDGFRVATEHTHHLLAKKATDTIVIDDPKDQIGVDYGNFYYFDSGTGMLDIDTCEEVNLHVGFEGADSVVGTANVRAIREGNTSLTVRVGGKAYNYQRTPKYKLHLFNIKRDNYNYDLRDVKSVKSSSNAHLVNLVPTASNGQPLHEPRANALIFDTPLRRPKAFTNATVTIMKKYNFTASGTSHTLTLTDSGETFVREDDVLFASSTEFAPSAVSAAIQSGNKELVLSGLTNGTGYEVIAFVKKTNASVKNKTLTETTVTASLDSDGKGTKYISLGKSDIYSIERVRVGDSDGDDIFPNFNFDAGHRVTHYDDGRLIWTRGGLTSEDSDVFVRFKYFSHSANGEFFAVNSYTGQVEYSKIPAQRLPNGNMVSLRDVIDMRPATDGSGSFSGGTVIDLVEPTATIEAKAEYYLPRKDKVVISRNSELRYISGVPSLSPRFPDTPEDCMDLYKLSLNGNTLHSKDMDMTIIPRKGYTMNDISKLEERIDRLEEMTTLSLLELNTKFLSVLDSSGNDRTKSGFFVDNFSTHGFSQTKSKEYRASIDKRGKLLRPTFIEETIPLQFDSVHSEQLRVVKKEDYAMLEYDEIGYVAQDMASGTENLAPFYNAQIVGRITLSPEVDNFYDTEKVGESVIGTSTKFDLKHALNWNNSENEWYGVDPASLEVGASSTFVSGTSTAVTHNSLDPVLIGQEITTDVGEWVETGTVTDVETLYTETVEISREREEEISRSVIDSYREDYYFDGDYWTGNSYNYYYGGQYYSTNPYGDIYGSGNDRYYTGYAAIDIDVIQTTTDMWDVVTSETREHVRTTNTTTYQQTNTINTENTYQGTAEVITTTTTSNTVNRIASESTIREIVGEKVIDISVIPFMRPIEIQFKAEGLRPNTQYFPFFDHTNVGPFCREETVFKHYSDRLAQDGRDGKDDEGVMRSTSAHSKGSQTLTSDANGDLIGSFEVPNNASMRFATGVREFALLDVNAHNFSAAMSFARANFTSAGTLEKVEDQVSITRVLKVVGENFTETDRDVQTKNTVWTETIVSEEVATDVVSTSTTTTITGDTTTTREFVGTDIDVQHVPAGFQPPYHDGTDTSDNVPPGGTTTTTTESEQAPAISQAAPPDNVSYSEARISPTEQFNTYLDPLAQTFLVEEASGVTLTTVRVYFATKADTAPVFCEIRPTVNGVPSATKIIAQKKLLPSQVTTTATTSTLKQVLRNGTDFTFDAPVYLAQGEYAIVLRPGQNNPDYNCYVATVGEKQLGSNDTFISQQPTLGGFFKSQNGKLWEPSSGQDLCYKLSVAKFKTSGNVILENANVPPVNLAYDPLRSFTGDSATSNTIFVAHRGHGLRTGDKTNIRGIDSATSFGNGLTGADVNGIRTVVSADNAGYTFELASGTNANKPIWFGGASVTSSRNLNFEQLRPELRIAQPGQTDVTLSIKTTTQQSLAGDETRFTKDSKYQLIQNQKNNTYKNARAVYNRLNENLSGAGKLGGKRSATMQVTLKTSNPLVSPMIDLQSASLNLVHNLISKQDSASTDGFNVPIHYVGEGNPMNGTESAKHVTTVTTLTEEAVGLKILLAANKPPAASFDVYYRLATEGDPMMRFSWIKVDPENTLPADTNPNVFREYRYLVGGADGLQRPFTRFQIKIVMRSTSSAQVPKFRDLRAIALAV